MATAINPEKSVDVPPHGDRNPDPISDQPGSHPVETGIGAAVGGAASGMAVGAVTGGPVGAVAGIVLGAIAGGLAGKGVGELIDPTTEDNWLRDNYKTRPYATEADSYDKYVPAYRYGAEAESKFGDEAYGNFESELEGGWPTVEDRGDLTWEAARPAVKDGYDRSRIIREKRMADRGNS